MHPFWGSLPLRRFVVANGVELSFSHLAKRLGFMESRSYVRVYELWEKPHERCTCIGLKVQIYAKKKKKGGGDRLATQTILFVDTAA